jgi:FkbM family methyltransferase
MRKYLEPVLVKFPVFYRALLRYRRRADYNVDKFVFLSTIRADDVIVDAGAHTGYYTLLFSNIAGAAGQVHAFEPVPPTFRQLGDYVRNQQHYGNIFLKNVALSDTIGSASMYTPGSDDRQSSLEIHAFGSWSSNPEIVTWEVVTTTLDHYAREKPLEKLDFLKVDTEGAELLVLKGACETITRFRPLIYVEMCNQWFKDFHYSGTELVELLQSLGYENFYLVTDVIESLSNPARELSAETFTKPANLLCADNKHHNQRIRNLPMQHSL